MASLMDILKKAKESLSGEKPAIKPKAEKKKEEPEEEKVYTESAVDKMKARKKAQEDLLKSL